jgi:predicted Zn finger-like uncharacterized protein
MIVIQCPHCQTCYSVEEQQLTDHPNSQIRCKKCQNAIPRPSTSEPGPTGVRHPLIHHNEFNRRLQTIASPSPVEATTLKTGDRPWLDEGKVISLVAIDGPMKGKIFPVIKPSLSLGRRDTDIVLDDSDVSRKHCVIEIRGGSAVLVDLGSTNGTFVNEQRVETHQLEHMSEFRIGSTTLIFSVRKKE